MVSQYLKHLSNLFKENKEKDVQIPSANQDVFIKSMSNNAEQIRTLFLGHVTELTKKVPLKVMLGDGTVTDQESFDPARMRDFLGNFLKNILDWKKEDVSSTSDEDLRRIFIKFEVKEDNYLLSGHLSLQYHTLLFYKLDHRVIEIQKELSDITDKIQLLETKTNPENDKIIEEKLRQQGYENVDHQKLFEIFFQNDALTKDLLESVQSTHQELTQLTEKRSSLFKELDNMLIEVYHTTPVLIDETRMIAAEEGCLCNFNLEYSKGNIRQGDINLTKIPERTKVNLLQHLDDIIKILKN